jgi:antitoxin component YwqK of YwqJK toxin-antitoxin module
MTRIGAILDGKMEGKWQTFFEDGSLKTEGVYKGGFKDGAEGKPSSTPTGTFQQQ